MNKGYTNIQLLVRYLKYRLTAKTRYGVHSPFVFKLIEDVIREEKQFYVFKKIERQRSILGSNKTHIQQNDFGAGSRKSKSNAKTINQIVKQALISSQDGELLFKLIDFYKCAYRIELGTSLGISTSYIASAKQNGRVVTFEGDSELVKHAKKVWSNIGLDYIDVELGNIDETLPLFLEKEQPKIDFVFIDANHTYEATIQYFEFISPYLHDASIIVMDDIHWSSGMELAWEQITAKPEVSVSIDMFTKGVLFFSPKLKKEHFILRV